jgi:hypothetical protein
MRICRGVVAFMALRPARQIPPERGYRLLTKLSLRIPRGSAHVAGISHSDLVIGLVAKALDRIESDRLPTDAEGSDLLYDFWPRYVASAEFVEITVWYRAQAARA